MDGVNFDLFGNPVQPRREGPGRPPHEWTLENSHKINLLFACNRSPADVAKAIGISLPTLRKVYFSEFAARRAASLKLRAHQLYRLNQEAAKGSVPAEKALVALVQAEQVRAVADQVASRGVPEVTRDAPEKLGKKAAAVAGAKQLKGTFATRNPPPGLLN